MAKNTKGGYRKPSNPAAVSGPGALSKRTDGGPTQAAKYMAGGKYGEGKALLDLQRQAPMAAASAQLTPVPAQAVPSTPLLGLTDKTSYPDRPITHGLPVGPGAGPEVMPAMYAKSPIDTLRSLSAYDNTGETNAIANILIQRGVS